MPVARCALLLNRTSPPPSTLSDFELEVVHLGQEKGRVPEAEQSGVQSVPALVLDNQAYHINFGASLDALK
jgi:hypothetical protein